MPVPEHLISELRAAAAAAVKTETAIADTRAAMVEAAAQLHSLIEQLPVGDVASLGLRVEIVARGTPLVSAPSEGLRIKTLPSLPEGDFDVRPGATALYLEVHVGGGRIYLEIRSNPGELVHVSTSLKRLELSLENVRGISIDQDGQVRLVRQWIADNNIHTEPGPDTRTLLQAFISAARIELESRARFNRAVDVH